MDSFLKTDYITFYEEVSKLNNGMEIYKCACEKLEKMKFQADYRNNKAIKKHIDNSILPLIAIYQSLTENGLSKEEAYNFSYDVAKVKAEKNQKNNLKLGKLPFSFALFMLCCKKIMAKDYPDAGWKLEWVHYNNKEVQYNMKSCIYFEMTQKYNCTEL